MLSYLKKILIRPPIIVVLKIISPDTETNLQDFIDKCRNEAQFLKKNFLKIISYDNF